MTNEAILLLFTGLIGSGGLVAFLKARAEVPKIATEAQSLIIQNLQSENARLHAEINVLRERVSKLEARIDLLIEQRLIDQRRAAERQP